MSKVRRFELIKGAELRLLHSKSSDVGPFLNFRNAFPFPFLLEKRNAFPLFIPVQLSDIITLNGSIFLCCKESENYFSNL